ncbi:Ras-interacting protein RIP3 [Hondaea fermentalgiana]|uniref:Ras-interacting protein RIP3 n=1 Tax=Hondaea fermentalgiana TaxID=2315210 RepID=A0A2R5GTL2_9STRA|nr:Ras-interacting protein RIP3 [Hondaea fermentalgiana]|eukprot:GBG34180.1 Ras-interacting protein RIP3 [Hondaea fermentalgiana]
MHFSEVAELEDKVSLVRSERMLTLAATELHNPSALSVSEGPDSTKVQNRASTLKRGQSSRVSVNPSGVDSGQERGGLFGSDPVVARLFASSPPDHTFTLEDDDDLRDDSESELSFTTWRERGNKSVLRRAQTERADHDHETTTEIHFDVVPVEEEGNHAPSGETNGGDIVSKSGLSSIFGGANGAGATRNVDRAAGAAGRPVLVYLPDLTPVHLTVPLHAKVSDVIQALLDEDRRAGGGRNARLYPDASKYELRMHDEDGLPELDLPACDGDMDVENFGDGDEPEFCICPKAGVDVDLDNLPDAQETGDASEPGAFDKVDELLNKQSARLVKITLPENGFQTSIKSTPGMTAVEVLRIIQTKQRLPLFTEEYLFTVSEEERAALGLASCQIGMKTDLYAANIRHLELSRRQYADAPSQDSVSDRIEPDFHHRDRGSSAAIHDDDDDATEAVNPARRPAPHRFNPENVLFNDQTARHYEEWDVIKTNKWGKRQRRVLGIDHQKVYNKKQDKDLGKNMLSKDTVKRAERDIADVKSFRVDPDDARCVEIRWKAPGEGLAGSGSLESSKDELTLKYEVAAGPEGAARIVAKLQYLKKTGR